MLSKNKSFLKQKNFCADSSFDVCSHVSAVATFSSSGNKTNLHKEDSKDKKKNVMDDCDWCFIQITPGEEI